MPKRPPWADMEDEAFKVKVNPVAECEAVDYRAAAEELRAGFGSKAEAMAFVQHHVARGLLAQAQAALFRAALEALDVHHG